MTEGNKFSKQDEYTIKASASKASAETDLCEDSRSVPTLAHQSIQDPGRGLPISGQGKLARKRSCDDTTAGFRRPQAHQQASKALPGNGLVIAGQSSSTQQSQPKDKLHQPHSKGQTDGVNRKRASSSGTLEIVGAASQPKSQQQPRPTPTKSANISRDGVVSISGTAETPAASKLDMSLPPSHAQQEASDEADAKRLRISGGRKKRSLFGYRMEAILMDNAATSNNRSASSHEPHSLPRAADSSKTAAHVDKPPSASGQSTVALQTTPETRPVGITTASTHSSTVVNNDSGGNELRIARSATSMPGADQGSNKAAPFFLRIANSSAEHNVGLR
ncbi:hypothetical protein GGI13_001156 [Coemansia sp. RSA 455]|nr:hypothetical protein LPJ71_002937 [Coemansia sp. S17]KAJ2075761.1 hypothetical protein GGH13_000382 [Coemansia sp. S155-1]KAJ2097666.1 hypothetical protein GGI16_004503 [Coemansia sp. S142-1]KAJ2256540.1 hypothetical protein GGI13_001156 [Coemansia sp. RSA 455]